MNATKHRYVHHLDNNSVLTHVLCMFNICGTHSVLNIVLTFESTFPTCSHFSNVNTVYYVFTLDSKKTSSDRLFQLIAGLLIFVYLQLHV